MRKRARPLAAPWRRLAVPIAAAGALAIPACRTPEPPSPVERGRQIFFEETFAGNGRTCGTCHPAENNLTLDPAFIAGLPPDDPLFVAEFVPELRENFENPRLMREFALILENQDGFDDLENRFVLRGIPHTLALRTSVASPGGPKTGWSGDGAPGDRSLRSFATGAVVQHFTKTLARQPGVDFRLPTDEELDALEAFQLSLGRQAELALPLPLRGAVARRGQEIFLDDSLGKCNICHRNAGANAFLNGADLGNANFSTGIEALPDRPARLTGERVPPDDGQGFPGDGTFNTPPLVEAADTGPFFHDHSVATLEGAVAFYSGDAFNASPSGLFLASLDPRGIGIRLDATQTQAVAAFLRVLNALENIRQGIEALDRSREPSDFERAEARRLIGSAIEETGDAIRVLAEAGLHTAAVERLEEARRRAERASCSLFRRRTLAGEAIAALEQASAELVEPSPPPAS
jgi:mono/diheme cytochrome c family protein